MGLKTTKVFTKWTVNNKLWYENRGYVFTRYRNEFQVKVEDLPDGSHTKVIIECNCCQKELKPTEWRLYKKCVHEDGSYYCNPCAIKIRDENNKYKTTMTANSISFEQWCIENNRQDILDRWDYELNKLKPNEVPNKSIKKYWFKCNLNIHDSESRKICDLTSGKQVNINCKKCNSFAQWGIDNLGEDFLDKYWDYEKNMVDPWVINRGNNKLKIWITCQKKDYHGSYDITCNDFTSDKRCPYCINNHGKVHPLDSLGVIYPNVLKYWSNKNKKSPYEYSPKSSQEVWWKCPDGTHKDYQRSISSSNSCNFRCPDCQFSKGEEKISKVLINLAINYEPQKTFDKLLGLRNGLLSYDFYLSEYNLLIEYQGIQHEKYVKGIHKNKNKFKQQLEHDRRKREYAENNNIKLLEIWYWDFDNIEEILGNIFCKYKTVI